MEFGIGICPTFGHVLRPGRVLVGWCPCGCKAALGNHRGHRTRLCLDCADIEGETTIWFDPPHSGGFPTPADKGR